MYPIAYQFFPQCSLVIYLVIHDSIDISVDGNFLCLCDASSITDCEKGVSSQKQDDEKANYYTDDDKRHRFAAHLVDWGLFWRDHFGRLFDIAEVWSSLNVIENSYKSVYKFWGIISRIFIWPIQLVQFIHRFPAAGLDILDIFFGPWQKLSFFIELKI